MEREPRDAERTRIISRLNLKPHPEGGWYHEVFSSGFDITVNNEGSESRIRPALTSIYFLLSADNFSAFHRLKSDEIWYHHEGDALDVVIIHENGICEIRTVGSASSGYAPQTVVPARSWFASRIHEKGDWSLVGCAVSPGFDFEDFQLANRQWLCQRYPDHTEIIHSLTRE